MAPFGHLVAGLDGIEHPLTRPKGATMHRVLTVVAIAVLAAACGADATSPGTGTYSRSDYRCPYQHRPGP